MQEVRWRGGGVTPFLSERCASGQRCGGRMPSAKHKPHLPGQGLRVP